VEAKQSTFLVIKYFGLSTKRKIKLLIRQLIKMISLIHTIQGNLKTMRLRMERMKIFLRLSNG